MSRLKFLLLPLYIYTANLYLRDVTTWNFIDYANLMIHEVGHSLFTAFGFIPHLFGGSIFQLLIPMFCIGYFFFKHDFAGVSFSFYWLGTSFFNVARYIADAQEMALPLVFGNIHDWNYLLTHFNILQYDDLIATQIRILAWISLYISVILLFINQKLIDKFKNG